MALTLSPLWISLKTAAVATVFAFIAGTVVAGWMFGYRGRGKGSIDGILTLPLVLPPTVVGFLLLLLLGRNSPLGRLLMDLGIRLIFSWPATVIAATVVAFPLIYKTVLGAFEQVDRDLIACARTLGATEVRIFLRILLPLAWPGVVAGTILAFARALGEFGATLMLAGSIPGKTQTMPIAIFLAAEAGKMDEALAWVLVTIAIALGAIGAINYWTDSHHVAPSRIVDRVTSWLDGWMARIDRRWNLRKPQIVRRIEGTGDRRGSMFAEELREVSEKNRKTVGANGRSPLPRLFTEGGIFLNCKALTVQLQQDFPSFSLNVNFTANGQPLGILGASGSGKSLTLRCIAGLETPTRGRIVLNGRVLFDSGHKIDLPSRQRRIGFVFQNYALFPHLRVADNIGFGLQDLPEGQRQQQVDRYLELFQLRGLERSYPRQLSGGQQQRVALARALAIAPEALLLDEPLSALDSYLRSQIEQLLADVFCRYQGVTLFVTHKLEEAYRVCGDLLVLSQGNILASGSKAEIFERPPNSTVARVTECKNFSRVRIVGDRTIVALDWNCTLQTIEPISPPLTYVGIRAHHLAFPEEPGGENTFPCWLVRKSETQHRMTLYLKLGDRPGENGEYHLQAEVFKEKWQMLENRSFPWFVRLHPQKLILMAK